MEKGKVIGMLQAKEKYVEFYEALYSRLTSAWLG